MPRPSHAFTLAFALTALCGAAPAFALDVDLDPARIYIDYVAHSGAHSGPVQLASIVNTPTHPFIVPCDVISYGPQVDIRYLTDGPTLYPQLQSRLYVLPNTLIWSDGSAGIAHFSVMASNLSALAPFTTQTDGQPTLDAPEFDPTISAYTYQASDLPANQTVRHTMHIALFDSDDYSHEITDDNVTNNNKFVYVRRSCP